MSLPQNLILQKFSDLDLNISKINKILEIFNNLNIYIACVNLIYADKNSHIGKNASDYRNKIKNCDESELEMILLVPETSEYREYPNTIYQEIESILGYSVNSKLWISDFDNDSFIVSYSYDLLELILIMNKNKINKYTGKKFHTHSVEYFLKKFK